MPSASPVVLITGGARGLGRSLSLAFAQSGFAVAVHYRQSAAEAADLVDMIRKEGQEAEAFQADVRDPDACDGLLSTVEKRFGHLDVLVNNAGSVRNRTVVKLSNDDWRDVIATNLDAVFYCSRAALPLLRQQHGTIISMGSYAGERGAYGAANYAAAKAGVAAFTKSLAIEEGPKGVRVNAVLPGFHVTDINRDYWEKSEEKIRAQHLLADLPDRDEMAAFVVHIALLRSVTGQVFTFESRIV